MRGRIVQIGAASASAILIAALAVQSVGAAPGDGFNCNGCIDKKDIGPKAVGSSEIVNKSVAFKDLSGGAVKKLQPKVFAQMDGTESGEDFVDLGVMELNTITFTAPRAGFLVITGQVFVNNREASPADVTLLPKLDGVTIQPGEGGWSGWLDAAATGTTDQNTFSYRAGVAVTAGSHTVSHDVDGTGNDLYLDRNNLIVMFFPAGKITTSEVA